MDAKETRIYLFDLNLYFKGGYWPKWLKELASKDFMKVRDVYAKEANKHFESINKKWDRLNPGVDLIEDNAAMDRYNRFVAKELLPYLSEIKWSKVSRLFVGATNPETAAFRLILRTNNKLCVDYDMTPKFRIKES